MMISKVPISTIYTYKNSLTGIGSTRKAQVNNTAILINCIYYKPKPTFLQRVRRWYRANH
ncbi:hypothetical protein MUDAN_BIHEEGNE_00654 [Lactiplantibacillus mudanjiangensis]|nr:hypothetical protein MUDAN_BIHEEGNE_00654 [Lactiplantibacillus mudanjiangensis]